MNVVIANEKQEQLANFDADIIKSLNGQYDVKEIIEMFKNFFYSKMIIDVTAINNFTEVNTYEELVKGLDPEKIIFLLPEGSPLCTPAFLSHLISVGIYNFTTDLNGVKYLLNNPNTLDDVKHITKMSADNYKEETGATVSEKASRIDKATFILGVRNITESAGATTLIYMLKKELGMLFGSDNVVALEVESNDFSLFADKGMVSVNKNDMKNSINNFSKANVILVDLNKSEDDSFCNEVIYLIEPSTIKLNRLIRKDRNIFKKLSNCKVILNKSLLLNNDVYDFEKEAGIKIFYNMPPLDERKRNAIINDFLVRLGLVIDNTKSNYSNKIFGLFRR